jgi:dTDP-4-amino-4,6-dideoxygalactose transaminase
MNEVRAIADTSGIPVIEDSAQVPGASIQGRKAGTWGDVGIWSFGGSKLLTAGRGGALFTHRADIYQRARTWLQRGNLVCPLSELQAAVLLPQLGRLDERNRHRARQVARLVDHLADIPGLRPFANRGVDDQPAYYKLGFQFEEEAFGLSRSRFVQAMRAEGVALDEGFHALHVGRSPRRFRAAGELVQANRAHGATLVLHHPVLLGSAVEIQEIDRAVRKIWQHRTELQRL